MKRFLRFVFSAVIGCMAILTFQTAQAAGDVTIDSIDYTLNIHNFTANVAGATVGVEILNIPDEITYKTKVFKVVGVGPNAFYSNATRTRLKEVKMGNNIKTIYGMAFYDQKTLKSVIFNEGLDSIYPSSFAFSGIKVIKLPNSLSYLGQEAFYSCEPDTLEFGTGLSIIPGACFFSTYYSIPSVVIPSNIQAIEGSVFGVDSLVIEPGDTLDLGSNTPFLYLRSLKIDRPLKISKDRLGYYPTPFGDSKTLTEVSISCNKNITPFMFSNNTNLSVVNLRDVEYIDKNAFAGSDNIKTLNCYSKVPPECVSEFSDRVYAVCCLNVPPESLEAYREAPVWKNFLEINGIVGINDVASDEVNGIVHAVYYNLQGQQVEQPGTGLYIKVENGKSQKVIL